MCLAEYESCSSNGRIVFFHDTDSGSNPGQLNIKLRTITRAINFTFIHSYSGFSNMLIYFVLICESSLSLTTGYMYEAASTTYYIGYQFRDVPTTSPEPERPTPIPSILFVRYIVCLLI